MEEVGSQADGSPSTEFEGSEDDDGVSLQPAPHWFSSTCHTVEEASREMDVDGVGGEGQGVYFIFWELRSEKSFGKYFLENPKSPKSEHFVTK